MESNSLKTTSVTKLGKVEIAAVKEKINNLNESDWDTDEDYDANYNKSKLALTNANHIIFKFSNKQVAPYEYFSCSKWKEWKNVLLPLMNQATNHYGYEKGHYTRVMLAKLPAKSFIRMHKDGNIEGTQPHKIHIPIQTNDEVYFYVENERFHFEEGTAYEVNNSAMHAAANNGNQDRIHLIFEYLNFNSQSDVIKEQLLNTKDDLLNG